MSETPRSLSFLNGLRRTVCTRTVDQYSATARQGEADISNWGKRRSITLDLLTRHMNWKSAKRVISVWRQPHIEVQKALLDLSIIEGATVVRVILLELWPEYGEIARYQSRYQPRIASSCQASNISLSFSSSLHSKSKSSHTLLCQYWGANAWGKEPACHQTMRRQAFPVWGLLGDAATLLPSPQSPVMCDSGVMSTLYGHARMAIPHGVGLWHGGNKLSETEYTLLPSCWTFQNKFVCLKSAFLSIVSQNHSNLRSACRYGSSASLTCCKVPYVLMLEYFGCCCCD